MYPSSLHVETKMLRTMRPIHMFRTSHCKCTNQSSSRKGFSGDLGLCVFCRINSLFMCCVLIWHQLGWADLTSDNIVHISFYPLAEGFSFFPDTFHCLLTSAMFLINQVWRRWRRIHNIMMYPYAMKDTYPCPVIFWRTKIDQVNAPLASTATILGRLEYAQVWV